MVAEVNQQQYPLLCCLAGVPAVRAALLSLGLTFFSFYSTEHW